MLRYCFIFFLITFLIKAQSKKLIRDTFYQQSVNSIDEVALKNGYSDKKKIRLAIEIWSDSKGKIFKTNALEDSKPFESALSSIISEIPNLNADEYISKGDTMRYVIEMRLKLPKKGQRKKIADKGLKIAIDIEWFLITEYFPLKDIIIEEEENCNDGKLDQFPLTESCTAFKDQYEEMKRCLSSYINGYVNRKFDVGLAAELGLPTGRYKIEIIFYISKEGDIVNIVAKSAYPELNEEAVRVINSIPKFLTPAIKDGKPVELKYGLPIRFIIA
jgi:hypothetical protein